MATLRRYELTSAADQVFDTLSGRSAGALEILLLELSGSTLVAPRRAHRQPRRGLGRGARVGARRVRGHGAVGDARPLVHAALRPVPRVPALTAPSRSRSSRSGSSSPRVCRARRCATMGCAVPGDRRHGFGTTRRAPDRAARPAQIVLGALLGIIAVSLFVHLHGLHHDLPAPGADEPYFVLPAARMAWKGDPNPQWFGHPGSTVIYPLAIAYRAREVLFHGAPLFGEAPSVAAALPAATPRASTRSAGSG